MAAIPATSGQVLSKQRSSQADHIITAVMQGKTLHYGGILVVQLFLPATSSEATKTMGSSLAENTMFRKLSGILDVLL